MSASYRLVSTDGSPTGETDSLDGLVEIMKAAPPGRYQIETLSLDLATGELRSWSWAAIVKDSGGRVELDLPPWLD
jgi:hypothetical protein